MTSRLPSPRPIRVFPLLAFVAVAPSCTGATDGTLERQTQALTSVARINFQPEAAPVPAGYEKDIGLPYDATRGFGWVREDSLDAPEHVGLDLVPNTRDRNRAGIDQRLDTLIHLQYPANVANPTAVRIPGAWEYALADGTYRVTVAAGDQPRYDSLHVVRVEGTTAVAGFQGTAEAEYMQTSVDVTVSDGRLTIDAVGGQNTKLGYVVIERVDPSGARATVTNRDGVPFADRLAFSRIGSLTNPPGNGVHDRVTARIGSAGTEALVVSGATFTGPWAFVDEPAFPLSIAPGESVDLAIVFRAGSGDVHEGSLALATNDPGAPTVSLQLGGFWQSVSEGGQEPDLAEMMRVYGYTTVITNPGQPLNQQGLVTAVGDEVLSPYWLLADATQPVAVRQLGAFHSHPATASVHWHAKGSNTASRIFTHASVDAQSLLPRLSGSATAPAEGSFTPAGAFGLKIDGEWSDPAKNNQSVDRDNGCAGPCGHHVRFWPVKDRAGAVVPFTYLMVMDYSGINYDYNDNVYLLTNLRPE